MSTPILIPISYASRDTGLYVPIHRRNQGAANSYSSSSLSSRSPSPSSTSIHHVYTPADLLSLSQSPLARRSTDDMDVRLHVVAPEIMRTRKQRKALAWHVRHPDGPSTGRRRAPRASDEEDGTRTWRRV